jgi:hypothetical protein
MTKNVAESLKAAKLVEARANMCWENAAKLMWTEEYARASLRRRCRHLAEGGLAARARLAAARQSDS